MRINNHRWAALAVAALILAGCGPSEEEKLVDACTAKSVGMKATVLPLHWAIGDGNVDSVRALIEAGADVNAKDVRGATALHQAAYGNNAAVAALLIEAGADVNAKNVRGATALHQAAYGNNVAVAAVLIEAGADVNAVATLGASRTRELAIRGWRGTPLELAAVRGHAEVEKLLREAAAPTVG